MKVPQVLILEQDRLIIRALSSLLATSPSEIRVFTSHAANIDELIVDISGSECDLVLMGKSMKFAAGAPLAQLLMVSPNLRVVVADEESNWVHIFGKEDRLLAQLTDLVSVIFSDWQNAT